MKQNGFPDWLEGITPGRLLRSVRNNPGYAGGVAASYGVVASQILIQVLLVPFYISALGKPRFGVLMIVISAVAVASTGLVMMQGRFIRLLSEKLVEGGWPAAAETFRAVRAVIVCYGTIVGLVIVGAGLGAPGVVFGSEFTVLPGDVALGVAVGGLYPFLLTQLNCEMLLLFAARRQAHAHLLLTLSNAIFVVTVVAGLLAGFGLVSATGGFAVAVSMTWLLTWRWRLRRFGTMPPFPGFRARFSVSWALFDRLWRRFAFVGLLFALLQADILIVGVLGGAQAAAEFVLVWKVAEVIVLLIWRFGDNLQPEIIHMDLRGERGRLQRVYADGAKVGRLVSLAAGLAYAFAGAWVVRLWVGPDAAPDEPLAYMLAGGAIVWLGSVRIPVTVAYGLARLDGLIKLAATELVLKWLIAAILFPVLGYAAILGAVNIVHLCGMAFAYAWLARRVLREASD